MKYKIQLVDDQDKVLFTGELSNDALSTLTGIILEQNSGITVFISEEEVCWIHVKEKDPVKIYESLLMACGSYFLETIS